mgnify:CR=1 FL=1
MEQEYKFRELVCAINVSCTYCVSFDLTIKPQEQREGKVNKLAAVRDFLDKFVITAKMHTVFEFS